MADNLLNADLGPVHWTGAVSPREPRQEGRGRHGRALKHAAPADESADVAAESSATETPDSAPHKLDSFA